MLPLTTYKNVSYTKRERAKRKAQEDRLMQVYACGYSALVKKSIDTLEHLTATKELHLV
tara:strand:+ start:186 stop:362 length:177 start_codon:yes stop_codon:yes gene_type:complete